MSKRQVWVVERRAPRGRVWRFECVHDAPLPGNTKRDWTGVDGARYRLAKYEYVPEEPTHRVQHDDGEGNKHAGRRDDCGRCQ